MDDQISMFLSEEPPVSRSAWLASEKAWMTRVATWPSSFLELLKGSARVGFFGKTSMASCQPAADGTLVPSSGRWGNSGMGGPTEFWTLNTSESPSSGDVSLCALTEAVDGNAPPASYLTKKAYAGILWRAANWTKELPPALLAELTGRYSLTVPPSTRVSTPSSSQGSDRQKSAQPLSAEDHTLSLTLDLDVFDE